MSRKERVLKKRYAIFCEGDTEYNYIDKMRKNQGVELVLKPINMHGGGYTNFLKQIKKEEVYEFLNTGNKSYKLMLDYIEKQFINEYLQSIFLNSGKEVV